MRNCNIILDFKIINNQLNQLMSKVQYFDFIVDFDREYFTIRK